MTPIKLFVNGREVSGTVEPRMHLADFLRDQINLTATHLRCEQGVCGACTVLIDGEPARSCIAYAVLCQGAEVTTLEGLEHDPVMKHLRLAFAAEHGLQCGFCTPGMLITARDIVRRLPEADRARVRVELSGNLCRCTGYSGIVNAICRVIEERRGAISTPDPVKFAPPRLGPVGARQLLDMAPAAPKAPSVSSTTTGADVADEADIGLGSRQPNLESTISFTVARPVDEVWAALEDIERVAPCMPGARLTEPPHDGRIKGQVAIKFGPITTSFSGTGLIVRDNARRMGVVYGTGRDRLTGSRARAEVGYVLDHESEGATRIKLTIQAALAGPLAQFGRSGIVQDLINRLAAEFARRLEHSLATGEVATPGETSLNTGAMLLSALRARMQALLGRFFPQQKP